MHVHWYAAFHARSRLNQLLITVLKNSTFNEHQTDAEISKYGIYDIQTF
jgi:hypothetical protein